MCWKPCVLVIIYVQPAFRSIWFLSLLFFIRHHIVTYRDIWSSASLLYIDVPDSLLRLLTTSRSAFRPHIRGYIWTFFGRVCHLDKEAIYDGCSSENARYRWGFWILSDFWELSLCGPCGPYFFFFCFFLMFDCIQKGKFKIICKNDR